MGASLSALLWPAGRHGSAKGPAVRKLWPPEQDGSAQAAAVRKLVTKSLVQDAAEEWPSSFLKASHSIKASHGANTSGTSDEDACSTVLRLHGLCAPELLRPPRVPSTPDRPFVFLHFSKCAGTSMMSGLDHLRQQPFSLRLPPKLSTASACRAHESAKCCWWRHRLLNLSASGEGLRVLTQEPANDENWLEPSPSGSRGGWRHVRAVDPGFDVATDLCDGLGYATVLRRPVARVHSHMCEIGVDHRAWQQPKAVAGGVKRQLRDNYYVRSLGGAEAWEAPEGGLGQRHLLAAARALSRFDVVMSVEALQQDARAQMGRVGLPGFAPRHVYSRSRSDNLHRAAKEPWLRARGSTDSADSAACEVPPTAFELSRLVAACTWDAILYEFARTLAARRSISSTVEKTYATTTN